MNYKNIKNILNQMMKTLSPRTMEVVEKRFGLKDGICQTLEAIGKNLKITRERVRQIEALGLKQLLTKNATESLGPVFDEIERKLMDHGNIRHEKYLLKEAADLFSLKEKNSENTINFILTLGKNRFSYFKETPKWHAAWALNNDSYERATGLAESLRKKLAEEKSPAVESSVLKMAESFSEVGSVNPKNLLSYMSLSRHIAQNPFGEWGVVSSPEISPKGVKDKAYLVLKKENRPLHFGEVADLINKTAFSKRKAHPQTVHNELIKDGRFVLVGRGTYALADWGYEPGTVRDVLVSILKKRPEGMNREEIIKTVQEKRLVKENTILLNLQNRKVFKKSGSNLYTLA